MTRLSQNALIGVVARHYGTTHASLVGPTRAHPTVLQRQVAMWCLSMHFALSTPAVGKRFGGRDHTTVLHALGMVATRLGEDAEFAADVGRLIARIHAAEQAMETELAAEIQAKVAAAVQAGVDQRIAEGGVIEAHICLDGVLGPAVKVYLDAVDAVARAEFTRDEALAIRARRDALRALREAWTASQPVPA